MTMPLEKNTHSVPIYALSSRKRGPSSDVCLFSYVAKLVPSACAQSSGHVTEALLKHDSKNQRIQKVEKQKNLP